MLNYSVSGMQNIQSMEQDVKYYARLQIGETLDMMSFAEHIENHLGKYSAEEINAILGGAVRCLRELLLDGKKIQLGAMGAFHLTVSSEGTRKAEDFSPQNIKKVHVRWTPGPKFRDMLKDAKFTVVPSRKAQKAVLKAEKDGEKNVELK